MYDEMDLISAHNVHPLAVDEREQPGAFIQEGTTQRVQQLQLICCMARLPVQMVPLQQGQADTNNSRGWVLQLGVAGHCIPSIHL